MFWNQFLHLNTPVRRLNSSIVSWRDLWAVSHSCPHPTSKWLLRSSWHHKTICAWGWSQKFWTTKLEWKLMLINESWYYILPAVSLIFSNVDFWTCLSNMSFVMSLLNHSYTSINKKNHLLLYVNIAKRPASTKTNYIWWYKYSKWWSSAAVP